MQKRNAVLATLLADSVRDVLETSERERDELPERTRKAIAAMREALGLWDGKAKCAVRPLSGFRRKV